MLKRFTIAIFIAGLCLMGIGFVVVQSSSGSDSLCTLAIASLEDAIAQPVEVESCLFQPFTGNLVVEGVQIGPSDSPVLLAEGLNISISLRSRLRIDAVEVIRPQVSLDLSTFDFPTPDELERTRSAQAQRRSTTSCLPDLRLIELGKISLVEASFELGLPEGYRVSAEEISVQLGESNRLINFALQVGKSSFHAPEGDFGLERTVLEGEVNLQEGNARLHGLDLAAREGSVFGQAEITSLCGLRGNATLTARVDLEEVGKDIYALVQQMKAAGKPMPTSELLEMGGNVDARLRANFDIFNLKKPVEVQADLKVIDGRALVQSQTQRLDMGIGHISASVTALINELQIHQIDYPLDSGRLHATGTISTAPPFELDAVVKLENASLGEFLYRLGVDPMPVDLLVNGKATGKGPLWGPDGMRLDTLVDAEVRDFGVYSTSWQQKAEAVRYVGLAKSRVTGRLNVGIADLDILKAQVESEKSLVEAWGHLDYIDGMTLQVRSAQVDLGELGPYSVAIIEGKGAVSGTVAGPWLELEIKGDASVEDGRVQGLLLGDAIAKVLIQMDYTEGTLKVSDVFGRKGGVYWSGFLDMDVGKNPYITDSHLVFAPSSLVDLALTAEELAPAVRSLEDQVEGLFQGEARFWGPALAIDGTAELDISELKIAGQHFGPGKALLSMKETYGLGLDLLSLEIGDRQLKAQGSMSALSFRHSAQIELSDLHVRHLDHLDPITDLDGHLNLRLRSGGLISNPRASGELVLVDWFMGERPLWNARLDVSLARGVADLHGSVHSPWPRGSERPKQDPDGPQQLPPGAMLHTLQGRVQLSENLPFTFDLDLSLPDASALFAPGELGDIEGGLSGQLHARGDLLSPMQAEAILELDRLWGRKGRWNIRNTAPVLAVLEHGRLSLQELPIGGPGFNIEAFGVREADGELDLTVRGRAELGMLRNLIPGLDEAQGFLDLDVALSGSVEDPALIGYARLEDGLLRPSGALFALENARGLVTFSPEALMIDGLEGQINGGPVELSGSVEMDNFVPQRLDLRLALGEIPLRLEGIPLVLAGSPTISGSPEHLLLGGELEVVRFRFQRDIELERVLVQAIELARRPPAPKVFERSGEFLTLDMGVHLGDVRVENNLLHSDLRGDLRLTGTNRRPGLLGTVTLVGGTAWVRNTEFDITSGVVNFSDRTRIRPTFDLHTQAQVRDYDLSVTASGTPQQPRILLASDPPLPEADIVTLLTLGITARDFDDPRADTSSIGGFLVDAAYNASGLNRQIQSLLPQTDILRDATFRLSSAYSEVSGNIEPIAQFETKFLTDDLRLRGQTSLLGNRGRRAQAEYRLDERISAQVQWDSDNPNAPSIGDIGGDLKLHWELP